MTAYPPTRDVVPCATSTLLPFAIVHFSTSNIDRLHGSSNASLASMCYSPPSKPCTLCLAAKEPLKSSRRVASESNSSLHAQSRKMFRNRQIPAKFLTCSQIHERSIYSQAIISVNANLPRSVRERAACRCTFTLRASHRLPFPVPGTIPSATIHHTHIPSDCLNPRCGPSQIPYLIRSYAIILPS